MIHTKTRGKGKGIGVTYNFNYGNETPLDFTDYQNEYGQGENGVRPTTPNPTSGQWSFGEKFAPGMTQHYLIRLTFLTNHRAAGSMNFTGMVQNITNTVRFQRSGERRDASSLTNIENKGIIPNNKFKRNGINLGFGYNLSNST